MQELLNYMITGIIDGPIEISTEDQNGMTVFNVSIPKDQVGMVIGRGGKTINALKNILKIRAIRENVHVDIQITEA